jgi:hypothetical protein
MDLSQTKKPEKSHNSKKSIEIFWSWRVFVDWKYQIYRENRYKINNEPSSQIVDDNRATIINDYFAWVFKSCYKVHYNIKNKEYVDGIQEHRISKIFVSYFWKGKI